MNAEINEYARLRWHCRRGTRELDLLLERFLETEYGALSFEEQVTFETLLSEPNEHLREWLLEGVDPPHGPYGRLVAGIRAVMAA